MSELDTIECRLDISLKTIRGYMHSLHHDSVVMESSDITQKHKLKVRDSGTLHLTPRKGSESEAISIRAHISWIRGSSVGLNLFPALLTWSEMKVFNRIVKDAEES